MCACGEKFIAIKSDYFLALYICLHLPTIYIVALKKKKKNLGGGGSLFVFSLSLSFFFFFFFFSCYCFLPEGGWVGADCALLVWMCIGSCSLHVNMQGFVWKFLCAIYKCSFIQCIHLPSLISRTVSVDVKHHVYLLTYLLMRSLLLNYF